MNRYPMTTQGLSQLQKEIHELKFVQRPLIIEELARAREHGDLSENAEYKAAREKQLHIDIRIQDLERILSNAQVIDISTLSGKNVVFGAYVTLYDEEKNEEITYQIVGEYESDLSQKKIAINSALARALIGKSENDSVEFSSPRGEEKHYTIRKVFYQNHLYSQKTDALNS